MAEQTFIMIKPDGVQRGLVRPLSLQLSILLPVSRYNSSGSMENWDFYMNFVIFLGILCLFLGIPKKF